jgi:membrane protein DedA with SNARE-associated domain
VSLGLLLAHYGYWAILVGTFFEGETVLVLGGLAAHRGYLHFWPVVAVAFVGSVAGDQLYFQLGRRRGAPFLRRRPRWGASAARARELVRRYETPVILGFRFLFGLRTVTPFVLGMGGVSPLRFSVLNALSALLWAVVVAGVGYALGDVAERLLADARRYERFLFLAVAATGALVWTLHFARRRASTTHPRRA